jgi:glycosyltransferase involved in cell wall biosynthesis
VISIIIISKDEEGLDDTLTDVSVQVGDLDDSSEIVVVDASGGRLDHVRRRHQAAVRWLEFQQPSGVRVSIPHQRNVGVRAAIGDVIVFTDAGCRPGAGWLARLVAPLHEDEHITAGVTRAPSGKRSLYEHPVQQAQAVQYLSECATINLAFRREVFDAVGGFDEEFAYGSDVDFSWRLIDVGYRIRSVSNSVVHHDYGTWRRQLRRSYVYGKARVRLYQKHRARVKRVLREDPMVVVYPAFLIGLPLTLVFPLYPALLLIPAWRNRSHAPVKVIVDHLVFGLGVLAGLICL